MKRSAGFTLIEMLIAVVVIGISMTMLAPVLSSYLTASAANYAERAKLDNQRIAAALLDYARNSTALGVLPAPYSAGGRVSAVYNPGDTTTNGLALTQTLVQSGVVPNAINDDGTAAHNVRVYQRVTGLVQVTPLYFRSGPLVSLGYQAGVIYQTPCKLADTGCNPNPATGLPGDSLLLTAANYATWSAADTAIGTQYLSTLPMQTAMLTTTSQRLDRVRDALMAHFRAQQLTAAAGDTTNWFPPNPGTAAGANPATNQGCRDGWYDLSTSAILPLVGLGAAQYGQTAWGGAIQYCRDYDPAATQTADAPPHFSALRINAAVSTGSAPDAAVIGNNLVLTL